MGETSSGSPECVGGKTKGPVSPHNLPRGRDLFSLPVPAVLCLSTAIDGKSSSEFADGDEFAVDEGVAVATVASATEVSICPVAGFSASTVAPSRPRDLVRLSTTSADRVLRDLGA
jgi:hypothetical protein